MEDFILSDCELFIMKEIWSSEKSMTLQDILERVNDVHGKNWSKSTVSAFLGRIVKKNVLKSERKGRQFYHTPLITEKEYMERTAMNYADRFQDVGIDKLVSAIEQKRGLSMEEKKRLREILDELE